MVLKQCSINSKSKSSQAGQALIEYVLVLVVVVSIVLALMVQIFQPLSQYLNATLGSYVECLLETGEAPQLGSDIQTEATSECSAALGRANNKFNDDYKAAGGKGPTDSNGTGADGKSSKDSKNKSASSGKENGEKEDSKGNSDKGSESSGSSYSQSYSNQKGLRKGSGGGGESGSEPEEGRVVGVAQNKGSGFFRSRTSSDASGSGRSKYISGEVPMSERQAKALEARQSRGQRVIASTTDDGFAPKVKKNLVKPPPPKEFKAKEDQPMSFGDYTRYIFIAVIVLLIIILIGGQAFQLSKSWEK